MVEILTIIFAIIGGFTVLVFLMRLLLRRNVEEIKFNPVKYGSIVNEQDVKVRLDELLSKNNKIEAIKYLKENKKLSLLEAKEMIEKYAKENSPQVFAAYSNINQTLAGDNELINRVKTLLSEGKKLEAIKFVVESRMVGLKEAKDFVDKIN